MARYVRFTVSGYRAITDPVRLDVARHPLLPIIGVNECGKTTILRALLAFDSANDSIAAGEHLKDRQNLYGTSEVPAGSVAADIELDADDLMECLDEVVHEAGKGGRTFDAEALARLRGAKISRLSIRRDMASLAYSLDLDLATRDSDLENALAIEFVARLPWILYFDDFRSAFPESVSLNKSDVAGERWRSIFERLFDAAGVPRADLDALSKIEERRRLTILSKVTTTLNATLTKHWQDLRLEEDDALGLRMQFTPDGGSGTLRIVVAEADASGAEQYFYVRDRSKGFFWFFNFVMQLEFNPKTAMYASKTQQTVLLLDEPGSYLHALAQQRLCAKLRALSQKNAVIYCTHSHHLLNPEHVSVASIHVAERRVDDRSIKLTRFYDLKGKIESKRFAFQPLFEALGIQPLAYDFAPGRRHLIVEGVVDFYAYSMFLGDAVDLVVPAVSAESAVWLVSLLTAFRADYRVLWDNDEAGRASRTKAIKSFGVAEQSRFLLLPLGGRRRKRILQDLVDGADVRRWRQELDLGENASFDKVIMALYFARKARPSLLTTISDTTREAFAAVAQQVAQPAEHAD